MPSKTNICSSVPPTAFAGYIGGTLLDRLLTHPRASNFEIVTPVRSAEKAEVLRKLGAKPEIAALSEYDKIEELASHADVIFNLANADNVPQMNAVLKGIRKAHAATGKPPVLIHTGEYAAKTVYSDVDIEQIKSIPAAALHRNVDLVVIGADEEGYARSHLISPGIIPGLAKARWPGSALALSVLVRLSGRMPTSTMWPTSMSSLRCNLQDPQSVGHGWEGYYFVENGEVPAYAVRNEELETTGVAGRGQLRWDDMSCEGGAGAHDRVEAQARGILGTIKAEVELQWAVAQKNGGEVDFTFERGLAKLFGFA
ncbi:uncharacterized protein B0H18DRAFT_1117483 [Fomitopsis serialis]|uniref:uncharacterized protein n=1 Tax=Fomitopsis serialis TaxID=139415 RepID=UPI0020086BC5|nr:uncharacterized protein B0H18DRAFT_1117483 [Neoantrodia serialis]KAH9929453.1 hypothetical protein B0H18DRAFT_1117483 [Neoantrodia serialis]